MGNENLRTVYEQYWLHARHVEREMWLFTAVYAVIVAAVFAAVGANIPSASKIGISAIGALLSLLGFFAVYVFRIPFLKFVLMAELIAINDFKIRDEYRRFFPKGGKAFPEGKWFDLHDILAIFYSILTGIMAYFFLALYFKNPLLAIIIAALVTLLLVGFHYLYIRPKKYIREISRELATHIEEQTN